MPPVYDTFASVRRLMEAGVPENQAVALVKEQAQLLADTVATREDVHTVLLRLAELELTVKALDNRLGSEIAKSEARLIKYMVALAGTVVALVKVL